MQRTKHIYADVLTWIANGETVQTRNELDGVWVDDSDALATVLSATDSPVIVEFRIKPSDGTIKIGDKEITKPLTSPLANGTVYWLVDPLDDWSVQEAAWTASGHGCNSTFDSRALQAGLCWLTATDANNAAELLKSILTS